MKRLRAAVRRLVGEDSAQDLIEYAYLAAFVGLVGVLVWPAIVGLLGERYSDYVGRPVPGGAQGETTGVQGLWESPPPP